MEIKATRNEGMHIRVLAASLIGSAIEWFDYFLYGTATALIFNKLFFPNADPVVGLMLSYLSFSLTFLARPFGGVILSHVGDPIGRKRTLVLSLSMMGCATVLIGCLPTYASIGVAAPILLVVLRILQSVAVSGEWGGALLLAYEYAPKKKKPFYACMPQLGIPLGMLLATAATSCARMLPDSAFQTWGWRVPFILSALIVVLGLWIRRGVGETPEFLALSLWGETARAPVLDTFRLHRGAVVMAAAAKIAETAPFYVITTFVVSYATHSLTYGRGIVLSAVTVGAVVACFCMPLMGMLAGRFGSRTVYLGGTLLTIAFSFPYFVLLDLREAWAIMLATVIAFGVNWTMVAAPLGTVMADAFTTEVRYTGITLGSQIGAALAGGTAPLVATWLLHVSGGRWHWIALYMALCASVSFVAVALRPSSARRLAQRAQHSA